MAVTFYLKDVAAAGSSAGSLADGVAPADASTTTKLSNVLTGTLGSIRIVYGATDDATTIIAATDAEPSGAPTGTADDCFRSENTLNGTFAAAAWTIQVNVAGSIAGAGAVHLIHFSLRLWRSSSATGAGAVEITSGVQATGSANPATTGTNYSVTFTPPAATLTNEYLFLQLAWNLDSNPSISNPTDSIQVGASRSFITTSNFTAAGGAVTAAPLGYFDPQLVTKAWFDAPSAQQIGPFDVTLLKADGSATAPAAPGIANFTSGPGKATGAVVAGASPGIASFASPAGKATGAVQAGASPGTATFTSAPGTASAPSLSRGGLLWWPYIPRREQEAEVPAAPGKIRASSALGGARVTPTKPKAARRPPKKPRTGPKPRPAVAMARGAVLRASCACGGARGGAAVSTIAAAVGVRAPLGGARGEARAGGGPIRLRAQANPGRAVGYRSFTDEELASAVMLIA